MAGPWDDYGQSNDSGGEPWKDYGDSSPAPKTDGAFKRGWNKAKQNLAITSDLALGDTTGAAQTVGEANRYAQANPGMQEGAELMQAWEAGDGISGGIAEVGREFGRDWDDAPNIKEGVKATGRNIQAMGEGIAEQTANMIAPLTGMVTGGIAGAKTGGTIGAIGGPKGAAVGGVVGGLVGAWGGASIGNAAIEGGGITQEAIHEAGIDPNDLESVKAYLDENSSTLLKQASIKGGIIGAVDTATAGIAGRLLNGPARAASSRILASMGVDAGDKAAVKAAQESPAFAQMLAQDTAYQASRQGAEKIARNVAAAAIDPAGEFAGEYIGSGIALDDWDAKNAALEAFSSIGQSGVMFAGQKAYQAATGLGRTQSPLIQPQPSAENPAPAPVPAPDPNAGAISRTAAMLPGPSIAGMLPAPDPVFFADSQGNVSDQGPERNVDREYRPTGREKAPRDFGPGMDQQTERGGSVLEGELIQKIQQAKAPQTLSITDQRADALIVDSDGNAVKGKLPTTKPKDYVQGGRGMDQQFSGKKFSGLPAANNAIRNSPNPGSLTAVKVGPHTFEIQAKPVLQNRDRSTPASITQMRGIAARPDYQRVSISRDFANGAPVVEPGASVPASHKGRAEVVSTASGRKISTQYAVIEAADLLPSHDINGSQNAGYESGVKGKSRAIAGNGRVTGISHAYTQGTAAEYRRALEADAAGHGISVNAIKGMKQPVLVRIMPQDQITQDIGDESNTATVSALSGAEQASNDAKRIDTASMQFDANGEITEATVRQFIQSMPEAERGALLDGGRPSRQAYDRAASAVFATAYESDELIRLQAQATDPEARTVLSGLLAAAAKMSRLKGHGQWDIRGLVVEAAQAAVNATRNGQTLASYTQQLDIERNPEANYFIDLFATNSRSAKRIGDELSAVAELFYAEASKADTDMFGAVPRRSRQDLLKGATDANANRQSASAQTTRDEGGAGSAASSRDARDVERAERAGTAAAPQPDAFQLDSYTEEELATQAAAKVEADAKAAADAKAITDKAQADRDRNDFTLSGSDRPVDVAASRGQNDLFGPKTRGERKDDQSGAAAPKSNESAAQRFIIAPDGSTDFGEITSDMAKAAGRQAGKIRLQQGNESWGLQHIEQRHGAEIRDAGFADVPAFVADIAQHIDQVWKPAATRQLVALHKVGNNRMMFVELQPGKDEAGDFYTVNTAFTSRKAEKKGWKLLWEARAQASGESGNRPSFAVSPPIAGGEVTNPSSQSSEPSIAPPVDDKPAAKPKAKPAAKPDAKVEDVGDQLKFNKKGMFRSGGLKWSDIASENDALKVKLAGKEKIWARPNWEQIIEAQPADRRDGFRMAAYLTKQVYDALPKQAPVKTDEGIQQYIDAVTELRTAAEAFLSDSDALASVLNGLSQKAASRMSGSFSILDMQASNKISTAPLFAALFPEQAAGKRFERGTPANTKGQMIGSKAIKAMQWGTDDAVKAMKAIKAGWPAKQEAWEKQGYAVHLLDTALTGRYFGMDDGKIAAHLLLGGRSTDELGIFDTRQKAEAAVEAKSKELVGQFMVLDKRKRMLGAFVTEVEATDFARAQVARKAEPEQQAAEQTSDNWDARTGEQRRPENKDVSPEELMEAFGFRGVNFGNWVKQGERRRHLNAAYDAFADLADLLNIPPKAISLNGMLGVAFGAQGGGKFAAHFVPGVNEINITKTRGAGSLAHEWAHALDHYFGTQAGLARSTNPFASTLQGMSKYSRGKLENVQLRPEVEQAFNNIVDVMRSRVETPAEVVKRRQDALQKAKEGAQVVADRLRPQLEGNAEALKALDAVMDGEAGEYVNLPIPNGKRKPIGAIPENIKTVYDALSYSSQEAYDKSYQLHRVALAKEQLGMDMMARSVHTQFYRNSLVLDGKKTPYWSTQWEMFARGFESWVMDALALRGTANSYLVGEGKADEAQADDSPYPRGSERALLNDAFGKLAAEIKYRQEEDGNVPLFSRGLAGGAAFSFGRGDVPGAAGTVIEHDAIKLIAERIGVQIGIGAPVITYRNEAELFSAVPAIAKQAEKDGAKNQVNAVYYKGEVHVVTSAFSRAADVEMAILDALAHEGQGHYGIRAMHGNDAKAVDAALREVFAAIGGVAGVKRLAAKNGLDLSLYLKTAEGMSERQRAGFLADELLAHLQGQAATAGLSQRAMAAIKAYLGAVREWLRGHGFPNLAKGTDADIALLLKRMREAAQRKPTGRGLAARFSRAMAAIGNNGDFDKTKPNINYRINSGSAAGIPPFSAKALAKKLNAVTSNKIVAVATESELPAHIYEQIKRDKMLGRVAGLHDSETGLSYLIAANVRDTKHAIEVMLHEAVGHGGVKAVLGDKLNMVMRSIYRDMPAAARAELERRYRDQLANKTKAEAEVIVAEEYVAHMAETDPSNSLLDRIVALVRKVIRDMFGEAQSLKWTRKDIVQLLAEAKRDVATDGRGPRGGGKSYRESRQFDSSPALADVGEVSEAEFVASLNEQSAAAIAKSMYRARGTDSPFFKKWFGSSRMVDKQGRPVAFVHRSYGERDTFRDADLGGNTGTPTAALGHYLARKDVGNVERYGPVTEQFFIRMEKPKVITQVQFEAMGDWSVEKVKQYRADAMKAGHDGLYIQGLAWPVVFEGRNIKAVRNQGTFDATDRARYVVSDATRAAYEARIDELFADAKPNQSGVRVLDRSDVLDMLGYGDYEVVLAEGHGVDDGRFNHPQFTAADWKKVPDWLENPVAVFKYDGKLTVIAPETKNGKPILIAVEPAAGASGGKFGQKLHVLITAYDKDKGRLPMERMVEQGDLLFVDHKKTPDFNLSTKHKLPRSWVETKGYKTKVYTGADLFKYRKAEGSNGTRYSVNSQTDTPAFKRWFGDSKVVDADGKPLVVYHGTNADIESFDAAFQGASGQGSGEPGFFFDSNSDNASRYVRGNRDGGNLIPVYLSLKNPLIVDRASTKYGYDGGYSRVAFANFIDDALEAGNDGVIFRDVLDRGTRSTQYVAFRPEQIKSAIGNNGDFDPSNPDIRYSLNDDAATADALRKLGLGGKDADGIIQQIRSMTLGGLKSKLSEWATRSEEGIFDGLAGIKRAEEAVGVTDADNQGYVSARMATGIADVMHGVLHYAAPEWRDGVIAGKADTRGVLEILSDLGQDNLTPWLAWLGGKRAQMLKAQGRENNLTDADIAELLAMGKGKEALFEKVYRDYAKTNEAVLDLAEQAGLIDPQARAKWATEYYVPFYRQTEDDGLFTGPRSKKGLSHQTAAIKALKGGALPTNDLLSNMLAGWTKRIDAAMKNKALLEVVGNLRDSEYLTDESPRYQQVLISRSQIAQQIRKDRKALAMAADMLGLPEGSKFLKVVNQLMKPENEGFEKLWTKVAPTDPDIIRVQRDGKSEYYRVNDDSLLRGLKFIEGSVFNDPITRIGRTFKRLLTTGVTASPDFILRNFIRDAAHAWMINKDGFVLGKDSIKGMRDALREDQDYRDLMFAGGSFQGGYVHGTDPDASAQIIRRALEKKGFTKQQREAYLGSLVNTPAKAAAMLGKGWQSYRTLGDKVENSNRLSTYKAALAAGKSKRQAAYEAKDLMDYALRGNFAAAQWFTDVVPFLNARLQGLYKLGRAMKGDNTLLAKEVAMKGAYIALFSLLLAGINDDDERYQELMDWDKDMHWHIFLGDQHFRIPKPFELGIIFGTVPERLLHALTGTQDGGDLAKAVANGVFQTLAFNPVPQFYQPIRELQANRNFFRDMPIEDMSDEGKLPEARFNGNTSVLGKAVGQLTGPTLGISPKQLDHLVQGYTGTLGGYVLSMSNLVAGAFDDAERPSVRAGDIPVVKVVYQGDDVRTTKYQSQFYDMMREADQLHRTVKAYREEGRVDAAGRLLESSRDKLKHRAALGMARQQLGTVRKQMDAVYRDTSMSGEAKRAKLDQLQARSNQIAERIVRRAGGDF